MGITKTDELVDNGCHPFVNERRVFREQTAREEKPTDDVEYRNNTTAIFESRMSSFMGMVWGIILFGVIIGIGMTVLQAFNSANSMAGTLTGLIP